MDPRSRPQPTLGSGLSRHEWRIEQDGARDNPILQSVDTAFRATARGRDVFHRHAVVALAVHHHVTVQGIEMTVNDAVICTRVLAVAKRIRALESDIGTRLLTCSGRKAGPTEAGAALLARARSFLRE